MSEKEADGLTLWHSPAARVAVGIVVGAAVTSMMWQHSGPLSLLGGWAALALVFTGWTWILLWRSTPDRTRRHAGQEQLGHRTAIVMILVGAVASLWGVWALLKSGDDYAVRALAVGSVVLSWFTIHTVFALIYAKTFYTGGHSGGIQFNSEPGPDRPSFPDFFYVAFALGVSFAVSDTNLTTTKMRKIALGHSLLSFVFGAIIIASVVNLISSGTG